MATAVATRCRKSMEDIYFGDTDRRLDAIENLTPQDIVDALSDELHDWLEEDTGEDSDFGDNITVVTGITLSAIS